MSQVFTEIETDLQNPRHSYRNYLRTIFTGAKDSKDYNALKGKLRTRLHQDFETSDTQLQPANKILIHILKEILTATPGLGYGFGVAQGSIPPLGKKTYREYLNELIKLTKVTPSELKFRYRVDFERPDTAMSSAVEENITALQGFFADTPESKPDPFAIVAPNQIGVAPFFLQFEEWVEQTKPFFPENFYQITRTVSSGVLAEVQGKLIASIDNSSSIKNIKRWHGMLMKLEGKMRDAHKKFAQDQYVQARQLYEESLALACEALLFYNEKRKADGPSWNDKPGGPEAVDNATENEAVVVHKRSTKSSADLESFTNHFEIALDKFDPAKDQINVDDHFEWLRTREVQLRLTLIHCIAYVIPVCRGDVAFAAGDYVAACAHYSVATRFIVGSADATDGAGYAKYSNQPGSFHLFLGGALPYNVDTSEDADKKSVADTINVDILSWLDARDPFAGSIARKMLHSMEKRFLKLRHGDALLEWADALYRTDDPASVRRARELYKAVILLHGGTPPISPTWTITPPATTYIPYASNPSLASQQTRAWRGFEQISLGLNYFGFDDGYVPWLRYRTLKDAADRFAAAAKSAQQDFLAYMSKLEEGLRESIVNSNMLKKAKLQADIANQQTGIAEYNVSVAQQQVSQVKSAIEAKKKEIEEHDDLFTQFTDWAGGFLDTVKGVADLADTVKGLKDKEFVTDVGTGLGFGGSVAGGEGGAAAGGAAGSGLAVAAAPMAAYALFIYAGVTSLSSMAEAQDNRHAELKALKEVALPRAEAAVEARKREVTITKLLQTIAETDAELAVALMKFQESRVLNIEFWGQVSTVVKRLMRRYLELGARFAWLAERALAYEQDRALDIIRFDYFPRKLQGVTGVDLLQIDLAELEATRLDQIRTLIPIKHTYSLAFDFPLQFAQLKKTGACRFQTTELPFRHAYPGTYGYRVIAMSVAVKALAGTYPARGLLRNEGISLVSHVGGDMHSSVRFPDAFPLSEFRLREDMFVYNLPGEALVSFEGSGVETFWELILPTHANPYGLQSIADIQLTFDVRASYSPTLYAKHLAEMPSKVNRFLIFPAHVFSPAGLTALRDNSQGAPPQVELSFDLTQAPLPQNESGRKVTNLFIAFVTGGAFDLMVKFGLQGGLMVDVQLQQGTAFSNSGAWNSSQSPEPPSVLNQFVNTAIEKVWQLKLDKNLYPKVDFSQVINVILGFEYEAKVV